MAGKMVSLRVEPALLERVDERAAAEGTTRSAWMAAAFESALAGPEPGALRAAVRSGPTRIDTPADASRWLAQRQAKLNAAKDRASG